MNRPIPLETPNLEVLKQALEDYFDLLEDEDTCEDTATDNDDDVMQAAIKAIYGNNADSFIEHCLNEIENRE